MYNFFREYRTAEKLYIFIWALYTIIGVLAGVSALPNHYPFIMIVYSIITNTLIIVLLLFPFIIRKYSVINLIFYIFFMFILFLIEFNIPSRALLINMLLIFAASSINAKKILSFDLKLKIVLFIFILLLWACGIVDNVSADVHGVHKHSLGFGNPNGFACYSLSLLTEWLCLHYRRMKKYQYLIIVVLLYLVNYISPSRTSVYSFLAVFALFFLADCLPQIFYTNISKILFAIITPTLAGLSFVTAYLYSQGNAFMIALNKIMTNRIAFSSYGLTKYDVRLMGQQVETEWHNVHFYIDNAYMSSALRYGLIYLIFTCLAYSVLFVRLLNNKQINMALLGLFFVILGFGEIYMLNIIYNVSMIYLLYTDKHIHALRFHSGSLEDKLQIYFADK